MNILAINGSYRGDKGYTAFLIEKVLAGAQSTGATCEVIHQVRITFSTFTIEIN